MTDEQQGGDKGAADLVKASEDLEGIAGHSKSERGSLEYSRRLLEMTLDAVASAIAGLDCGGKLLMVNRRCAEITGYPVAELIGEPLTNLLSSKDRLRVQDALVEVLAGGSGFSGYEAEIVRKDGDARAVSLSLVPALLEGKISGAVAIFEDLGGTKAAEQELRESEDRFRQIAENSGDIIWIVSGDGARMIFVNQAFERITGRRCESLYQDLPSAVDMIYPEDRAEAVATLAMQVRGVWEQDAEFRILRTDGAVRWVRTRAFAIRKQRGAIYRVAGIMRDVTDAKHAEEALRESEDRYRDLVENSGVLFGTHDEEGRILSVNRATVELAGFERADEMLGRKVSDFLSPDRRHSFTSYLELVLRGGRAQGFMRARSRAGEERILQYSNSLRREGLKKPIIRCIAHDVTEQKRTEKALRDSEERYRLVAENSHDLIALMDPEGQILYASPSHSHVLGYSGQDLLHTSLLRFTHTDDAPRVQRAIRELVKSGGRGTIELRLKKVDGEWLEFEAIISVIADGRGALSRLLLSARDITERRRAEESLHRISGRLIQLQDEERRRIARELHDSTAQSLAALSMNLEVANDSAAELSPRVRAALSESVLLATQCLREIRTLSYLLHPPQPDDFGLASALRWYVAGFAKRSGIEVNLTAPSEFPRLDQPVEMTLFRIVQESLSNIHRHSGSPTAEVHVEWQGERVNLEVRDNGRGIPAAILEHVNVSSAGLGVGIAGMRERVQQLGGTLEIHSDSHGTQVSANLPVGRVN